MSKSLQPSNFDEFIDLSEETKLIDSTCHNKSSPVEDQIIKNSKQLQLTEIKLEENKEIKEECKIEEKVAEDIQWFNEANKTFQGELKSFKRFNDKYEGEIKCGNLHGQGLYIFSDGLSYYKGEFDNGDYNGLGVLYKHPGSHYVGNWYRNCRSGFGKQIYENGDIYEGNWEEDKYNRQGVYYYNDGSYYRGNWEKGYKKGQGLFMWTDGTIYDGTWWKDIKDKGTIYYPNGCRLEGMWLSMRNNCIYKSQFFDGNGKCFNGIYEDVYNKYLNGIETHFHIDPDVQKEENERIKEEEKEKKKIEIAEEKKRREIAEKNSGVLNENESLSLKWQDLFKCFHRKNKKLD